MGVTALWALVAGFIVGVFTRSFLALPWEAAACAVFLAGAAYLAIRSRAALVLALALCVFGVGVARMDIAIPDRDLALDAALGSEVIVEGVVFQEPDTRENSMRLSVRTESGAGVLVVVPLHSDVSYGDTVRARGRLGIPERFETGEGRAFEYPGYLARDSILYTLSFAQVEAVQSGGGNGVKRIAIWIKQTYLEGVALALPEPYAGLAGGITVGDKRGVGEELGEVFRTVGLTHIIVLSGYNITIVIYAFAWILARLSLPRVVEFGIAVCVAVFFALITGLAAASVRAAAMAIIASVGAVTGRVYLASRALGVVAAAMVLWNPYALAFDPGFQLSILATAGLIAFSPLVAARLSWVTERFGVREIAAATLATQLAVLPFLLYQSGEFNLFALPVNLLTLVVIPWAMLLSAVAALAGLIAGPLAPLFGFPALLLLSYVIAVAEFFAGLPFASLALPAFGTGMLMLLYGALVVAYATAQRQSAPRSLSSSDS